MVIQDQLMRNVSRVNVNVLSTRNNDAIEWKPYNYLVSKLISIQLAKGRQRTAGQEAMFEQHGKKAAMHLFVIL